MKNPEMRKIIKYQKAKFAKSTKPRKKQISAIHKLTQIHQIWGL